MNTTDLSLEKDNVKREGGYAEKEIRIDSGSARREVYQGYYVYLVPLNEAVTFNIVALKALNKAATEQRVYWVAQSYTNFKTQKWLRLSRNGAIIKHSETLAEHLTALNKKSRDYKHVNYSEEDTKNVGKNYKNATYAKSMGKDTFGRISYASSKLGAGIWLEGINYTPQWLSQGAFVIAIDEPQIMSFYAKKRISTKDPNSQEKNLKFISKTITDLEDELEYGNIVDLHIKLHNVPYYDIQLTISVDGKELEKETIQLNRNLDNPILDYNVEQRYELYIKSAWIEALKHQQGSIKNGKISIILFPNRTIVHAPYTEETVKKIKKEISFKINYKDDWAIDEDEQEWIPQIAEIQEATLVTQAYEECGFTSIQISDNCGDSYYILKQNDDGSLKTNITTPIIEYVAGGNEAKKTITIELEAVETAECQQKAGFDNTEDNSDSHMNNTFNTTHLPTETVQSELFGSITPVKIISKNETHLQVELTFPYHADNKLEVFTDYIFGGNPIEFPLIIQSCRYIRTPIIKIYSDIEWFLNIQIASVNPEIYSYANFGSSSRTPVQNKKSRDAAINKKSQTREVSFELDLDAKYLGEPHGMIDASYEAKIKKMLELLVYIKNKMDSITGIDGSRAKKDTIGKLKKKLLKVPITFQLDYPVISIKGSWNNGQMTNGTVAKQGSIIFGFTPLIKGKGEIDLLALLELIPVVGQVLKAANMAALVAGVEIYFNLYAWGDINLNGEIHFNKEDDFALSSDTTVGIGVELGLKAEVNTKKLIFEADNTEDVKKEDKKVGFELAVKGETSITVGGKAGNAAKGPFIELNAHFNGIIVYVTARATGYGFGVGPKDEPYLIMKKPEQPLCEKRWYLLENKD